MFITNLTIENYKSLRAVTIAPTNLAVITGANAAGKSNIADALDFLATVYRHGLEAAVAQKGGYENIAFRRQRRARGAIRFQVSVELSGDEILAWETPQPARLFRFEHSFAFVARETSIRAPFHVAHERLVIAERKAGSWETISVVERQGQEVTVATPAEPAQRDRDESRGPVLRESADLVSDFSALDFVQRVNLPPSALFLTAVGPLLPGLGSVTRALGNIRVFQISPSKAREFGVPTPNAELERQGGNLPAAVDRMRNESPAEWDQVLAAVQNVLPDLVSIETEITPTRTLGLFFKERNIGRAWNAQEVSDGTIQILTLFMALFDPTSTAVVLEEPESSVHAWIIRQILETCRDAAKQKQVILTTHSPIVINTVRPEEVWIIWRAGGESHLQPLLDLDPTFRGLWEESGVATFAYLDTGAVDEAVPPPPVVVLDTGEELLQTK